MQHLLLHTVFTMTMNSFLLLVFFYVAIDVYIVSENDLSFLSSWLKYSMVTMLGCFVCVALTFNVFDIVY